MVDIRAKIYDGINSIGPKILSGLKLGNHNALAVVPVDENGPIDTSSIQINPTITVDTAAYAVGDCIGGKLTLTNAVRKSGGTGLLQNIIITDESHITPALTIIIFNSDPTAATLTDQAAVAFSTDTSKIIGKITVNSADYGTDANVSIANINVNQIVQAVGSANIYAVIIAKAAHDFVAATDLKMKFGFMRD